MRKISTAAFLLTFLLCSVIYARAQDKVRLKYNFEVGKKFKYQMKINGDVNVEIQSALRSTMPKNSAKMEGKFIYTHEITNVDSNNKHAQINVTYGKSYMHTIVKGQVIPNTDVPLLDGKVAQVTVAYDGKVKDYKLPEGLPASLQSADFRKMFVIFPERDLRIGESWIKNSEDISEDNENFTVTNIVHSKYTLLGIEQKGKYRCAKVKFESNTNTFTKSKKPELVLDGRVDGKVDGLIYYDLKSGYTIYSDLRTRINNKVVSENQPETNLGGEANQATPVTTIVDTDMRTIIELL